MNSVTGGVRRRARGRNLHDTERYDQLFSTSMTLSTAKRKGEPGAEEEKEERSGRRGKSGRG